MKPHKHAELIKKWADGAEIEIYEPLSGKYQSLKSPNWHESNLYRIKPEPKPDVHIYAAALRIGNNTSLGFREGCEVGANLRLTFDGETNHLKAAEVLK